jgi:ethanolamine-phosphate cytidylyltransferase
MSPAHANNPIQYIHAVIFSAPFTPTEEFLKNLPYGTPNAVYHGPTSFMPLTYDPYIDAKEMGIFSEVPSHDFQDVNAGEIVERIMKSRKLYEERQRKKGEKAVTEEAVKRRERMEQEAKDKENERFAAEKES